jgi:SAM-dependent methyltransferase
MDQDPFVRLRSDLWRELAQYRGKPIDYGLLRHALQHTGHALDWRSALVVGDMLSTHGEFALAPHVIDFVAHYAKAREPQTIFDPFVRVPALLAAAVDFAHPERAVGYVRSPLMLQLAQDIDARTIEWRSDDFIRREASATETFDLVVCAPPLGLRFDEIEGDGDLALLEAAARVLAPGGEIVFLLGEGFNAIKRTERTRQALAERGLHQTAVVSVADASPQVAIPLQFVIFRHGDPLPGIFVARLTAQMDGRQVVRSVVERRDAPTVELGRTVAPDSYSSWHAFAADAELERLLRSSPFPAVPLRDIASSIRRIELDEQDPNLETPPNAIYLTETRGVPSLTPTTEGAKKRRYVEVSLDPEKASAGFVIAWLNSPIGRLSRESVLHGATIPRLAATAAAALPVVLPPLEVQLAAVNVDARLTEMSLQSAELRARLWANPGAAREIDDVLPTAADGGGGLDEWIESLPFPLASIAYRYVADASAEDKVDRLLHLFEATAEFTTTLLLSAIRADPELFAVQREHLARPDAEGNPPFERGTFGSWLQTGRHLAKALRALLDTDDRERTLRLFGVRDNKFAYQLVQKRLWHVLDEARFIRNSRAHGGIEGQALRARTLERLEALLLDLREALGPAFIHVDLVQPGTMELRQGLFRHQARRLMGPNSIFRLRTLESVVPLDTDHLYVVDSDGVASSALQVLPFFRAMASPGTEQNAIYFYSSRSRDGRLHYVSYHFEAEPESAIDDPVLSSILDDLARAEHRAG